MRILITGANGQLAQDIRRCAPGHQFTAVAREQLDIRDATRVRSLLQELRPECVINTAAFHLVDACEDQVADALDVNVAAVCGLARAAEAIKAVLVHFSTDYVFDGAKQEPYVESDIARPLSVYGTSKLAGEYVVQAYCERHYVVRTCGLFGQAGSKSKNGNFVETMLRAAAENRPLRVVDDQVVTPTGTRDLARAVALLIAGAPYGLYHLTNTGQCSWYEFAHEIFRRSGQTPELRPVSTAEMGRKARRPAYSVLDNHNFRAAGFADLRSWQEALQEYLIQREQPHNMVA